MQRMKRVEAETLLETFLGARDRANERLRERMAIERLHDPQSTAEADRALRDAIRESHNARERVILALMQAEHAETH